MAAKETKRLIKNIILSLIITNVVFYLIFLMHNQMYDTNQTYLNTIIEIFNTSLFLGIIGSITFIIAFSFCMLILKNIEEGVL